LLGCISGMSREVLKVQFLRMKRRSLDHHGARSSLVQDEQNSGTRRVEYQSRVPAWYGPLVGHRRLPNSTLPNGLIDDF
jgi:hypothetical protein